MARWQFRRSRRIGPVRVTTSKSGISVSSGGKFFRTSVNSKGEVHQTTSLPGTGLYKREKVSNPMATGSGGSGSRSFEISLVDGTAGNRALLDGDSDVAHLEVVDLRRGGGVEGVADTAGLRVAQGIRFATLIRRGEEITVSLLVYPEDNPAAFSRRDRKRGSARATEIGKLGAKSARHLDDLADGASQVLGVLYIDSRPLREHVEARVRISALAGDVGAPDQSSLPAPPATATPPPTPADWYPDPHGEKRLRYFDGTSWTSHTAD